MNLIFDTNYILHKNVQVLHSMGTLYGDFHTMLNNNINRFVSMNTWDNVYIVSDSKKKSWRQKDLDDDYKGTRTKNQDIDWKWVYSEYDEFKNDMKEKFHVLQKDHIEGDDWITALILKTNSLGQSNVVISSDQDLLQLLKYSIEPGKTYINIQIDDKLNKERVFLPEGWNIWLKEFSNNRGGDVFNLDNSYDDVNFFNTVVQKFDNVEVNRYEQLLKKFVQGDKGDNVPCPYKTLTKTGKERGIGKAGAEKIWKHYSENYEYFFDTDDESFPVNLTKSIEKVNKVKLSKSKFDTVVENINSNIKLMELHYKNYPEWVLDEIIDSLNELF